MCVCCLTCILPVFSTQDLILSSGSVPSREIFPYLVVVIGLENVLVLTKSVVSTPVDLEVKLRIAQGMQPALLWKTVKERENTDNQGLGDGEWY